MADNQDTTPIGWRVTGQSERTIIDATGAAVNVMQVSFQLADGTAGTVNVPLGQYNPEQVRSAIAAKAATIAAVNTLTG